MGDDLTYLPRLRDRATRARLTNLQKAELLQELEPFSEASVEDLYRLAAIAQEVEFAAGQIIYHQDDFGDAFYLIVQGRMECYSESAGKRDVLAAGEAVGLASVLTRENRTMSAQTLEDTFALAIGAEDFYNLLSCNVEITVSLIKYFVKKVGMAS
jgi:potassium-dependent mechanosensitive channel